MRPCHYIFFFPDSEIAAAWTAHHPDTLVISVASPPPPGSGFVCSRRARLLDRLDRATLAEAAKTPQSTECREKDLLLLRLVDGRGLLPRGWGSGPRLLHALAAPVIAPTSTSANSILALIPSLLGNLTLGYLHPVRAGARGPVPSRRVRGVCTSSVCIRRPSPSFLNGDMAGARLAR